MSIAQCNVCSRYDRNISVICEGRCLICGRCQGNAVIRSLFVEASPNCPLCETPMSRTMLSWCQTSVGDDIGNSTSTSGRMEAARVIAELDSHPSIHNHFLLYFQETYGDNLGGVKYVGDEYKSEEERKKFGGGTDFNKIVSLPPKFLPHQMAEIVSDMFCSQWQVVLRNGNESMAATFSRLCNRKKMGMKTNDYRAKGIMDYFGNNKDPKLYQNPIIALYGRITGLLPRSKTQGYVVKEVRKGWAAVATCVLVLSYNEYCWKVGQLKDEDDNPKVSEVRTKFNKFEKDRGMALRRAFKLVNMLFDSGQPHWTMTPFLPSCREYNSVTPWEAESRSRLAHLLFYLCNQFPKLVLTGENNKPESLDWMMLIKAKAKELWNSGVKTHVDDNPVVEELGNVSADNFLSLITLETAYKVGAGLSTTAGFLALTLVEAWERECCMIQGSLDRAVINSTRRMGIRGRYDPVYASLSRAERIALLKILKYYANYEQHEIDWSDVREKYLGKVFPFFVPETLLEKSTAELNYHAHVVATEYDIEKAQELVEDVEIAKKIKASKDASLSESVRYITADARDDMFHPLDAADDFSELSRNRRLLKNAPPNYKSMETRHKMPALATLPYLSPHAGRNPLNIVDILDHDPRMLTRIKLLNRVPLGPHSSNMLVQELHDDITEMFASTVASDSLAQDSIATMSIDESDSQTASLAPSQKSEGGIELEGEEDSTAGHPEQGFDEAEAEDKVGTMNTTMTFGTTEDGQNDAIQKVIDRRKHTNILRGGDAKSRAREKIENARRKDLAKKMHEIEARVERYEEEKVVELEQQKVKDLSNHRDISESIERYEGDEDTMNFANANDLLAAEKAVKGLSIRNKKVLLPVIRHITKCYFKAWQLLELEELEISYTYLGNEGTKVLAAHLAQTCRLREFVYTANHMGESASQALIQALYDGGAAATLCKLSLAQNEITMVDDSLQVLGQFTLLEYLDLSRNFINADNDRCRNVLSNTLSNLEHLSYLDLGYNRIQNIGASMLFSDILPKLSKLETIKLRNCFLNPQLYEIIRTLLKQLDLPLKHLDISENIFIIEQVHEMKYFARIRELELLL